MPARTALVFVVLALLALAAGCGGEDPDTGEAAPPETEVVTDTVGETTTAGGAPEGDAEAGKAVFASAGCGGCHTLEAAGSSGTTGPNLDDAQPSFDATVSQVTNGGGGMPAFSDRLSEEEIRNVAAFVSESAGG